MQIHIEKSQKEIKEHGSYSFPVNISEESITRYEGGTFLWHWHPEIELTLITSGQMTYRVNNSQYLLKEGNALFNNCNVLHSGYMKDNCDCTYLSVTFHPRFIYGYENSLLQTKYVDFITSNSLWSSLMLENDNDWQGEIIDILQNIYKLSLTPPGNYELILHTLLSQIWTKLYDYYSSLPQSAISADYSLTRLKNILTFIQTHYQEPLSLEEIASNVNICKSECCRFFKKHMKMTLFEYLMSYRIRQSLTHLKNHETVANTALLSGFSDPCYFGKIFKRYMECTPRQYQTRN